MAPRKGKKETKEEVQVQLGPQVNLDLNIRLKPIKRFVDPPSLSKKVQFFFK